jgi:hypothetical protein
MNGLDRLFEMLRPSLKVSRDVTGVGPASTICRRRRHIHLVDVFLKHCAPLNRGAR